MAIGKKTGGRDIKKGQRLNPYGRPKKEESLTFLMKKYLSKVHPSMKKTYKEIFIEKTFHLALKGDLTALKLIWNYVDGMPQQKVDHTTQGEKIITGFNFVMSGDNTNNKTN